LFGTFVEDLVVDEVGADHGAQGIAHGLPALIESLLHDAYEELLIATQVGNVVATHLDDRRLHLRRRVEHVFMYGEEIVDVVPRLHQHT
jgi:hypothetical protein